MQRYTFRGGVQAMAQMAQYSEKFKMDMGSALDSAAAARNLENAVDMAAQLQVLGGEFAKTDPFQMLFLARNDPEQYAKKLNEMTKGVATFRKMADGSFQTFISPADQDRLRQAEKTLGLQTGELSIQAERMAEILRMRQRTIGMGLSAEEKTLLEGMYTYDSRKDEFFVQIAGAQKAVTSLGTTELNLLKQEQVRLDQRAKDARTFDETFKATVAELKTALLPLLNVVNRVLVKWTPRIEKVVDVLTEGPAAWLKVAGAFMGAAIVMKGAGALLNRVTGGLARVITRKTLVGGPAGANAAQTLAAGKGAGARAAGIGKGGMLGGIGAGIAAVGVGAGLFMAAKGISALADSMSKLNKDQADALAQIGTTLAITFPLAAVGIALAGKAAKAGGVGLAYLTLVVAGLGAAIAGATWGIGQMAEGLAKLREAKNDRIKMIADMRGSKEDFKEIDKAVKSISKADLSNLNPLAKLGKVFSKPLQVEFANDRMNMVADISLNVDGATFHTATKTTEWVINNIDSVKKAKGALLNA
jgi:hypothetical protein